MDMGGLNMNMIPHELAIGGVFLPPLLVAFTLGAIARCVSGVRPG